MMKPLVSSWLILIILSRLTTLFGHEGDKTLIDVGENSKNSSRVTDTAGRWGGAFVTHTLSYKPTISTYTCKQN